MLSLVVFSLSPLKYCHTLVPFPFLFSYEFFNLRGCVVKLYFFVRDCLILLFCPQQFFEFFSCFSLYSSFIRQKSLYIFKSNIFSFIVLLIVPKNSFWTL